MTLNVAFGLLLMVLGGFFFALGFFVYVDENKKIQNKLTAWWAWAESSRLNSLTVEHNILRDVARLTLWGFDGLFGKTLWSCRAISASVCLSLASFGMSFLVLSQASDSYPQYVLAAMIWVMFFAFATATRYQWIRTLTSIAVIIFLILSAAVFFVSPESKLVKLRSPQLYENVAKSLLEIELTAKDLVELRAMSDQQFIDDGFSLEEVREFRSISDEELLGIRHPSESQILSFAESLEVTLGEWVVGHEDYRPFGIQGRTTMASIFGLAFAIAILSDMVVIFATRKILAKSVESQSLLNFLTIAFGNVVLAIVFFGIPGVLGFATRMPYSFDVCFALICAMNWSVVVVAFSAGILGVLLLVNRIVWPNLSDFFDRMSTGKVVEIGRFCRWLGILLFAASAQLLGMKWISAVIGIVQNL